MSTTDLAPTIVCHKCHALNRVPAGRGLSAGKCGKCGASLATSDPVDIDGAMLNRLKSKDTGAFIIDVWAPWCGPCRMMVPSYAQTAAQMRDRVRFFKLNSDDHQDAASSLGLRGVPTLIAWNHGRETGHQAGAQMGPQLTSWVSQVIGPN